MAARFFARRTRKEASTAAQWEKSILKHKFEGHNDAIWGFVFLHDNIHIVSGSLDGTMRKWNCDTGLVVGEPWKSKAGGIYALALLPDGKIIACGREDGSVQLWNTDIRKMIRWVWTGHSRAVRSLSWSPNGRQLASGSDDGTILIRNAESGEVEVGPIDANQGGVWSLAYSPSGERIASGRRDCTICIWDTKVLVVGPIKDLELDVTSLMWSSDSTKLYSASDRFARVFDSETGELLHRFEHDHVLWSIALSPKHNVLACVGFQGAAQLWDTDVSFSQDGSHLAYGGSDNKLTLWVVKGMAPRLPASTLLQQPNRQNTQQETRSSSPSPSSSCLNADATGGGGFVEEAHDDPYNNFFHSSQQSLPSPSPGFLLPPLFLARRLWNVISRRHPTPDESELATMILKQPVSEVEGEQHETVDDCGSVHNSLSATKNKGKQRDNPPKNAHSPPSYDRALPAHLDSKESRGLWERLMQARGKSLTFSFGHSSTRPANAPQPILRNPWHWNSSSFPVGSSTRTVDVSACRDEDRYGITPETDAEAAAAMLRTNVDVAGSSTRPGQPAVAVQVSQGQPTQTQASTSGPEEIGLCDVVAYGGDHVVLFGDIVPDLTFTDPQQET
ncbi:WD40-repeat-containing domain protein [Suillus subaureus]|uniref:WD40-repeat-containing domain protein n=1 Tax=Suillus subaureus TaxID=48587 RepID=A0A9P7EEH7_9AGAM|nr:WD40-repeat-containing domain protein [Suillus subaureus]KAG1818695.1 WD40-repeat-containing domain protein [Suillus subaureus]